MKEDIRNKISNTLKCMKASVKWVVFSIILGCIVGTVGTLFHYALTFVTTAREQHPWLIWLLPAGGLLIVGAYQLLYDKEESGTNLVLSAIQSRDKLPVIIAPLIFFSTLISHLFGGSVGREGAALQLGGSIGNGFGALFRFDEKDNHILIMCGMSAAFSSLFGTPMAASIFSLEVVSVGIMHYAALLPCVIASLVAHGITLSFGVRSETYHLTHFPSFSVISALQISALAILCALVSILFCVLLHESENLYKRIFKNAYVRIFVGGCLVIALTLLVGSQRYNGAGIELITECLTEQVITPAAFLLKILFTAVTMGAGYKGGEILPSFVTGATFGCLFGNLIGFSPTLCTAIGMSAMFCGVTNCPITALLISFEMFGYDGMPYYLLAVALSYMLSGYFGLYRSQKIIYSKYKTNYINKKTS